MTPNSLLTLKPQQRKKTKFANRQAERRPFELEDKLDSDAIALWVEQSHITAVGNECADRCQFDSDLHHQS